MLSRRGLRPEAFISPGDSSDETVVFICATGRLHVRSAAALPLVSEASLAAPAPGRPRANGQPTLCHVGPHLPPHWPQVLRAVAHVAPWWLYALCMMALFIPTCACAGRHVGSLLAAHSTQPVPVESRTRGAL